MISFRRIMLYININIYTIDFSSSFQKEGRFSCTEFNLAASCWHGYPEIQTCLKPSLISSPGPVCWFSFHCRKRCIPLKERPKKKTLISVSPFFLFYKSIATPYAQNHTGRLKGLSCSFSMERKGQASGCSMKIQQPEFPLGLTKGISCAKVRCVIVLVINLHPFLQDQGSHASELQLKRKKEKKNTHKNTRGITGGGKPCSWKRQIIVIDVEGRGRRLIYQRANSIPIYAAKCEFC